MSAVSLLMLGLDHRTVPLEVREACRLSPERVRTGLTDLCAMHDGLLRSPCTLSAPVGNEAVVLSTCNRLELYVVATPETGNTLLRTFFLQHQAHAKLAPHLTFRRDQSAVEHLLHVASGLEPLGLGEPAILEQLADALALARVCGTCGPILGHLFRRAIYTGRRANAETHIHGRRAFLSQVTARFLCQRHPEMAWGNLLIVGAGKMARLAARVLQHKDAQPLAFTNRTAAHAEALAQQAPGQIFPWHQMRTALAWADVVITATAAHHPIIDADDIAAILPLRRERPLLLIDLGLPRNVHPAATRMESINYYDWDDLRSALVDVAHAEMARAESPAQWVTALAVVERMIQAETAVLCEWIERATSPRLSESGDATPRRSHRR